MRVILGIAAAVVLGWAGSRARGAERIDLTNGWRLQSSAEISERGDVLSTAAYQPLHWHDAAVPSTVVGSLVEDRTYPDPFFGMNLRSIPGMEYPIGVNFSQRAFPADSPFKVSWWYRKEFQLQPRTDGQVWLNFDGINYRANIWLNGRLIAGADQVLGAYRQFTFNVSAAAKPGQANVLAVEVFPPDVNSLAITWVDWNPAPPDKMMGLWRDVYMTVTGPVALRYPQVITKVDQPALDHARVIVSAEVCNPGPTPLRATVKGKIEKMRFEQSVDLAPGENRRVEFAPVEVNHPRLWWPVNAGPQNRYDLQLEVDANGRKSDADTIRFGIREVTSELNSHGYRLFKINGRPILIRGGGWAPDMFLRPSAQREEQEIRYVKDMHLNAIRFEGKTESGRFLDLCDREGIMVIAGWCCCDYWERWSKWKDSDYDVAAQSLRDQIRRLRNHPCLLTFWYGSDNPPNARAESNYLAALKEQQWPNPAQSSASGKPSPLGEPTGMRMTGPYNYVPPMYWYTDTNAGGAYSFNTETSPGPAIPPLESLRRMLPPDHLWPIDDEWSFHSGGGPFKHLNIFTTALEKRLGPARSVEEYSRKAQVMCYDGERAMFEAYARNKYNSTGVIQWMINNAWPSMIWHLYDYYLRPGGGYFGVKKACEPLHVQYSYDDASVVVVNGYYRGYRGLKVTAVMYNLDLTEKSSQETVMDLGPDVSQRVFTLHPPPDFSSTYFVKLKLEGSRGALLSDNFYWLSTRPDTLGQPQAESSWYYTPTRQFADLTALNALPPVRLDVISRNQRKASQEITRVTVQNPGKSLAFFVRLKVVRSSDGEEVLPVIWEDNYFSLLPGEKRDLTATYAAEGLGKAKPVVQVEGWNVVP